MAAAILLSWISAACPARAEDIRAAVPEKVDTAFHPIEVVKFSIGGFAHTGGALDDWGDDLVIATPEGMLVLARNAARRGAGDIHLELLPASLPMNIAQLNGTPFARDFRFNPAFFRVADILVEPAGNGDAWLYASHHVVEGACIAVALSRGRLGLTGPDNTATVTGWERIFTAEPCLTPKTRGQPFAGHQVGGKMARHADGTLWLALGDHEFDGQLSDGITSMDDAMDFGKVLSIDTDTGNTRIVARGLRNPQGFTIAADGRVWESEHGPRGGDEINLIEPGKNFGWPEVTLGKGYGGPWRANPVQGRHTGYDAPHFAWVPSIATSAVAEANGAEFHFWEGDLLVATLKDGAIHRLRLEGDRILYSERAIDVGDRVRDLVALPDGRLVALTDSAHVLLLARFSREAGNTRYIHGVRETTERLAARRAAAGLAEKFSGAALFNTHCATCHQLDGTEATGPSLAGVLDRPVGAVEGYSYSSALAGSSEVWTADTLFAYLSDPASAFPGTTMPQQNLTPAEARMLIKWLANANTPD